MTNVGDGDHLGLNGIDTVEERAAIKRVLVENVGPHGYAVLNAADPLTVAMASYCPGEVIFFSRDPQHPIVQRHAAHGTLAFVERYIAEHTRDAKKTVPPAAPTLALGGEAVRQIH